jgi:hypothetical protein
MKGKGLLFIKGRECILTGEKQKRSFKLRIEPLRA